MTARDRGQASGLTQGRGERHPEVWGATGDGLISSGGAGKCHRGGCADGVTHGIGDCHSNKGNRRHMEPWSTRDTPLTHRHIKRHPGAWCPRVAFAVAVGWFTAILCGGVSLAVAVETGRIQQCPLVCQCIDKGSIMTCRHSHLPHVPNLLSTTLLLDLDHNSISMLRNTSFASASHLEILSVEDNELLQLEGGVFLPLPALRILRLGNNHLVYIPHDVFLNAHQLEVLDLHNNNLGSIPDYALIHLHSLTLLNISYNRLTSPHLGGGFKYTTQLQSLDMSGNSFPSLEAEVFQVTQWWDEQVPHYMNLSRCHIRHVHPSALGKLFHLEGLSVAGNPDLPQDDLKTALHDLEVSDLQVINLSYMNISNIFDFFTRFQHRKLLELYLSGNNIRNVPQRSFFYLENLELLDLSFNEIDEVGDLTGLSKLRTLRLAYNHITALDVTLFEGLHMLNHLDLSHNMLSEVNDIPFQTVFDLHTLDLSCNQIATFSISMGLESLQVLYISYNRITSLDSIRRLLRLTTLDVSHNTITRLGPNVFTRGHSLKRADLSNNAIYQIDSRAFVQSSQDVLLLSGNKLTRVGNFGWRRVLELHLEYNMISNITLNAFKRLSTLRELFLQGNQLWTLPEAAFVELTSLNYLDLTANPLSGFLKMDIAGRLFSGLGALQFLQLSRVGLGELPAEVLSNVTYLRMLDLSHNNIGQLHRTHLMPFTHNHLHTLNLSNNVFHTLHPHDLYSLRALALLDLTNNPFHCTCDLMPFQHWMFTTNVSIVGRFGQYDYHCVSPPEWKAIPLRDFQLDSSTCSHHEKLVIFTAVGCVVMALLLTFSIMMCRHQCGRDKTRSARYSAIDESSTIQVNHHSNEWL